MSSGGWFDSSSGRAKRKLIEDDRKRVLFVFLSIVISVSISDSRWLFGLLVLFLYLIGWTGISWKSVAARTLLVLPFGLFSALCLPFVRHDDPVVSLLTVSGKGMQQGLELTLKLLIANFAITFLLGTTSSGGLLRALRKLGMPVLLVSMAEFTLRYLSVLAEETERMILSQKARGMKFRDFASWRIYLRMGQLLGVLLIRSVERSMRVYQAMQARGYKGPASEAKGVKRANERDPSGTAYLPVSQFHESAR